MSQSIGPLRLLGIYGVGINVFSAGLFYYDKQQAIQHKWRIPEKQLQLTGLLGGWIGGYFAMEKFKHKRAKQSFKNVYNAAVAGNLAIIGLGGFLFLKKPHLLPAILRSNQQMNQNIVTKRQPFNNHHKQYENNIETHQPQQQQQQFKKKRKNKQQQY